MMEKQLSPNGRSFSQIQAKPGGRADKSKSLIVTNEQMSQRSYFDNLKQLGRSGWNLKKSVHS